MAKIQYETVPAGGSRDQNNAQILCDVIKEGGLKGWKFVTVVSDFDHNFVVFEKSAREQRG